jgi:phosphoribosyl-ATP pyrophosphohydrolase
MADSSRIKSSGRKEMIKKEYIDKLNTIFLHFGKESQLDKLAEESVEYIDSYSDEDDNINSEIADVFVLSAQLVLNNPEIMKLVEFKINRTIERIQSDYYK